LTDFARHSGRLGRLKKSSFCLKTRQTTIHIAWMANLFDAANFAETEPTQIVAGDFLAWKRTDLNADYANDAYVLKYVFRLQGSGSTEIEVAASASGSDYVVQVASATTANYAVGRYDYQAYLTKGSNSERITIKSGELVVVANRDASTDDPIDHLRKRLVNLDAAIITLSTKTASSYSIAGRSMSYSDLREVIRMRDQTAGEINVKTRKTFAVRP